LQQSQLPLQELGKHADNISLSSSTKIIEGELRGGGSDGGM
jgi:hypothetical protein